MTFAEGGAGGASGGQGVANTGQGGDGNVPHGSSGGSGGSGRVIVKAPASPFAFYGSGVWNMNALYTYVKAGEWS